MGIRDGDGDGDEDAGVVRLSWLVAVVFCVVNATAGTIALILNTFNY